MAGSIGVGIGALGSGASASGSAKAGKSAEDVGDFNAQVALIQAKDAIERGREVEDQFRVGVHKLLGEQKAGFAGQGVEIDSGSAAEVYEDTAGLAAVDADRIKFNAQREAWGFKVNATNYLLGGQQSAIQANAQAVGTVLGGLGDAFTGYAKVSTYKAPQE
jgi:hypothetical protein